MICPKCGYDAEDHKFCPECGEKLIASNAELDLFDEENEPTPIEETQNTDIEEIKVSETQQLQQTKKKKIYMIIAAAAVVLVAAVIAIVCIQSNKIDVEKELFNSSWGSENATIFSFSSGGTATMTNPNGEPMTFVYEIKDDNKIQLSRVTILGRIPAFSVQMVKHKGVVALLWKTDDKDLYFPKMTND